MECFTHYRVEQSEYVVIEKWKRIPVFEGLICDAYSFDLPGYKVADEILVGDGILRITLIED